MKTTTDSTIIPINYLTVTKSTLDIHVDFVYLARTPSRDYPGLYAKVTSPRAVKVASSPANRLSPDCSRLESIIDVRMRSSLDEIRLYSFDNGICGASQRRHV